MYYGTLNTCDNVCGTMSRAKLSLHRLFIPYKVAFECHFGFGLERFISLTDPQVSIFTLIFLLTPLTCNILSFLRPLFQEGQLSVTGESMCTKYWLTA